MQQSKRIEKLYACIPSDQEESDQDINDEEIENGRILSNGVKKDNNADEDESEEESDMKQVIQRFKEKSFAIKAPLYLPHHFVVSLF